MTRKRLFSLLIFAVILPVCFPANILFFFAGGNVSHKVSVWPLVLALANRGHNVSFLSAHGKTPVPHPNITDYGSETLQKLMGTVYQVDRFKDRDSGLEKEFDYNLISTETCKAVINNRETDPALASMFARDNNFDLVVVNVLFGECGFFVAKYFNAKTIAYSACTFLSFFYESYGVSPEAAWIPDLIFTQNNIPLTFKDRVQNTLLSAYWARYQHTLLSPQLESAVKPLLKPDKVPALYDLENNVSIVLINSHVAIDFARTLPPLFVDIGGMNSWAPEKELPQKFKDFMDNAGPDGVVLISFGSTVLLNAISTRHQAMFFHLLHEFPNVRFLMRWKGPLPKFLGDDIPNHVIVSEWLPQREILSHSKLKMFITHGGISSIQEATYYGVPMIVLPLFADQDYNAYRIEAQEVGLRVEIRGMTEDTMVNAVQKVLKDDRYKKNMMKKSAIFRDRPQTPVEAAVFWTEFALRHEDTISTFRPMNQHLNILQKRLVDVYVFFAGVILVVALILVVILKKLAHVLVSILRPRNKRSHDKKRLKSD